MGHSIRWEICSKSLDLPMPIAYIKNLLGIDGHHARVRGEHLHARGVPESAFTEVVWGQRQAPAGLMRASVSGCIRFVRLSL